MPPMAEGNRNEMVEGTEDEAAALEAYYALPEPSPTLAASDWNLGVPFVAEHPK